MPALEIILASSSPRRRELLARLSIHPIVEPADIDETHGAGETAGAYVERLAREKASTSRRPGTVVIGADTAVVLDDEILGKPTSTTRAAEMLRRLSGREHDVITGVAVRLSEHSGEGRLVSAVERTVVTFPDLGDALVEWYSNSGEPADKAGGYGLQGSAGLFADRVEGSVTNVIGLPLPLLAELFAEVGLYLLDFRS